jgi:hypothetical protein
MKIGRLHVGAAAITAAVLLAGASHAAGGYSKRSLRGSYGFSGSGTLAAGTIQAAVAGLNLFDGAGGCEVRARLNAGGQVVPLTTASCSYEVNRDGTGTLDVTFNEPPFAGPFHSDFVIVDGTNQIQFVLSDPSGGTVASGVTTKQSRGQND